MKKKSKGNHYRAPTLAELQAEVDAFNARVSIGDVVLVKRDGVDTLGEYRTQTAAQILSGHSAVIWLEGISGCYGLTHVAPAPGPAVHTFESSKEAYAAAMHRKVPVGDVLLVPSERVVGVACRPPFAVTDERGQLVKGIPDDSDKRAQFLIPIAKAQTLAAAL